MSFRQEPRQPGLTERTANDAGEVAAGVFQAIGCGVADAEVEPAIVGEFDADLPTGAAWGVLAAAIFRALILDPLAVAKLGAELGDA